MNFLEILKKKITGILMMILMMIKRVKKILRVIWVVQWQEIQLRY